ncbi:MAG: alanine racemase [Patescibacteria group bacterium]
MNNNHTSWIEVNKSAILHNIEVFQKVIGPKTKLMAVVKSNAYGHGMVNVATFCEESTLVNYLGVVNLHEALLLRKTGITLPILVLSYFNQDDIHHAIQNDIDLPVYDFFMAELIDETARSINQVARIHIKIDTGTTRLGILSKDSLEFVQKAKKLKHLEIIGVFTHFADSENKNQTFTNKQIKEFNSQVSKIRKARIKISLFHAGCSASTLINKKSHFDLVRTGIGLYGLWPSEDAKKLTKGIVALEPALSWKAKIIQKKEIKAGTPVGYGCTVRVKKTTKIAVLPVGYYEGYSRLLSNSGQVLIRGKRCPIIGRVCMNLMMVDITRLKEVSYEDEVVILGRQGKDEISAEEIAKRSKTINYEVVTKINPLLPREYI